MTLLLAVLAFTALTAALVWARCRAVEDWHDHDDMGGTRWTHQVRCAAWDGWKCDCRVADLNAALARLDAVTGGETS